MCCRTRGFCFQTNMIGYSNNQIINKSVKKRVSEISFNSDIYVKNVKEAMHSIKTTTL